ncbi:MAG: carboxy terminal-processing peptidase [Verrucomicrobiota bacterium]
MILKHYAGLLAALVLGVLPLRAEIGGTNLLHKPSHLEPGQEDGRITFKTAQMLEYLHFSHHPLDQEFAGQFMDMYLEKLDRQHLHFLQTDIAGFDKYRTNLDRLTINSQHVADVTPAFEIYNCFIDRLQQRFDYVNELLKTETFDFTADERVAINRKDLPYPKDLAEAKKLWRQNLRLEYLQEKLGQEDARKNASPTNAPTKSIHDQIVDTLTHRYQRSLRLFADWNSQDVLGEYLTALAHVYDPHSDYFNKEQLDQFTIGMNLALFGIGAELRFDDGYCKITKLLAGGPAEKSKQIKPGDRIVAVAQSNQPPVDVIEMSLNKIVQLIRGPKGTQVELTLIPEHDSAPRTVLKLVRDEIPLPDSAAKGKVIEVPGRAGETKRLGVINLPSFYAPMGGGAHASTDTDGVYTSVDVAKLLRKFKAENVGGVILDLRFNGGGSLEEAIRLAGLFIKEGPMVQVKTSDGRVIVAPDPDPSTTYDGPLIVLTSRFSASASEIVAGALQDYGRALIVGDVSTHGKGTVQSVNYITNYLRLTDPEKNNGALKVTVQKFYRATGVSTQLKGVLPDIVLPTVWNYSKDIGENALDHPLECDKIAAAPYDRVNLVQPYLPELLKSSTSRIATNKDFEYVREEIERFRKQQEDKTVSLNEKQRRKEMQENQARDKARNKERLARKEPEQKVYELTLKQADLPGLPAPVQKTNSLAKVSTKTSGGTNFLTATASTDPDDEQAPANDVNLLEAEHILEDYISLMQKRGTITSNRPL